ncbi:MAG: hypothetical protein ACQKHC_02125 [Candidatus Phytoplasma pruni]|uniref:hypothetical protein n=1 Tax=Milkweed yellows phytoplasma TaxID=208434 RepID=UPI0003785A22|nr:hypothetical protein [Milkweed yellows phytoplasma]
MLIIFYFLAIVSDVLDKYILNPKRSNGIYRFKKYYLFNIIINYDIKGTIDKFLSPICTLLLFRLLGRNVFKK